MIRTLAILCLCSMPLAVGHARETEVRLLDGSEQNGTWGTDAFQIHVHQSGRLGSVKVGSLELIQQAGGFHASPVIPNSDKSARCVLKPTDSGKPIMTSRNENSHRVFNFDYVVTADEILDGAALCRVRQKVTVTSGGEITVVYEYEWLQTVNWHVFRVLTKFNEAACQQHGYQILIGDQAYVGTLEPGPPAKQRFGRKLFDQLTIASDVGPFHFVWTEPAKSSLHWNQSVFLDMRPPRVDHRTAVIYPDYKSTIAYRILLPVPQQ